MAHDNYLVLFTFGVVKHDAGFRLCEKVSLTENGENPALVYFLTYAKEHQPLIRLYRLLHEYHLPGIHRLNMELQYVQYSVDLILIG
jgi:hypothetical protein